MNTAKLLSKRFQCFRLAEKLLRENLALSKGRDDARKRILLGSHFFDLKDYAEVIAALSSLFDSSTAPSDLEYQDELLGRVILALSLLALNRHEEAQAELVALQRFVTCFGASFYPDIVRQLLSALPVYGAGMAATQDMAVSFVAGSTEVGFPQPKPTIDV